MGLQTVPSYVFCTLAGGLGVFVCWTWGMFGASVVPGLLVIAGVGGLARYLLRRVVVGDKGIRIYNGFGTLMADYPWRRVELYQPLTPAAERVVWVIGASGNEQAELPGVDDPYGLQRAIIPNLPPGALQPVLRSGRPLKQPPTEEIHEKAYRPADDTGQLILRTVFLGLLGAAILYLGYEVLLGHLSGFMIGIVILAGMASFRSIFAAFRALLPGRRIEMTAEGLVVSEDGTEKSIAWRDLLLVERRYLPNPERQAYYILLFDGQTSIAYRENWRHTEALLRYAAAHAPSTTVFTGFDTPLGPRL